MPSFRCKTAEKKSTDAMSFTFSAGSLLLGQFSPQEPFQPGFHLSVKQTFESSHQSFIAIHVNRKDLKVQSLTCVHLTRGTKVESRLCNRCNLTDSLICCCGAAPQKGDLNITSTEGPSSCPFKNPPVPPLLLTPEGLRPGELLIICSLSSLFHWPLNGQQAFYYLPRHQCLNNNRKQCQHAGGSV